MGQRQNNSGRIAGADMAAQQPDTTFDQDVKRARALRTTGGWDGESPLLIALKAIQAQRDYMAEFGEWIPGTMLHDQEFDDWAADLADEAIARHRLDEREALKAARKE